MKTLSLILFFLININFLNAQESQPSEDKSNSSSPLTAMGTTGSDILKIGEVMLVTNDDVESIATLNSLKYEPCFDGSTLDQIGSSTTPILVEDTKANESEWKFSVRTSFGGQRDKLEKHHQAVSANRADNRRRLDGIINGDFENYSQRRAAMTEMCSGMSEAERIDTASLLATRLGGIYDYSRSNGGSTEYIAPEEQWQALQTGEAVGVCRDAALTVSHFLSSCGFDPSRIEIQGYRTVGGGHQVVSVTDSNGDTYTINWSELFIQDESAIVSSSPNPSLINTGLFHTVYDSETGEVRSRERTELALALKDLTGGDVDPNLLPQINALEASNGSLAFALFNIETLRGDSAVGGAGSMKMESKGEFVTNTTSFGLGILKNEREIPLSATQDAKLEQTLVYMQFSQNFKIDTPILQGGEGSPSLSLVSNAGFGLEGFYSMNQARGEKDNNFDIMAQPYVGSDLVLELENLAAYTGGNVIMNVTPYRTNSQSEKIGFSVQEYTLHGGVALDHGPIVSQASTSYTIAHGYTTFSSGLGIQGDDKEKKFVPTASTAYTLYNHNSGLQQSYIRSNVGGSLQIDNIDRSIDFNAGVQVPIGTQFRGTMATFGLGFKF